MADPALGVRAYLLAQSSVTAIVGSSTSARFYPEVLPQNATLPAVSYETISDLPDHCIGAEWGRCGYSQARIAIDCYAATAAASKNLARTIMSVVSGPTARLRGVYGGVNFFDVMIDQGSRTEQDPPNDGSDERRYLTTIELMVSYFDE